ncbi:MAG: hypothetical protein JKY88_02965 [Pseudomonadales bacterium]|nr:hypothetical protein [Pseudomonadales bacterium]
MKETTTAGGRASFKYEGSTSSDIQLFFKSATITIPTKLIKTTLANFQGKTIIGGFSMTDTPVEGLGYYIREYSKSEFNRSLSPRYASHLSAIFRDEGLANLTKDGRRVVVNFK